LHFFYQKQDQQLKIEINRHLKTAAKVILSLGILAFVLFKIDTKALLEVISRVNIFYLSAALLAFVLSKWIAAFRLNKFLAATGVNISNRFNLKLYLLGMFYNLFLPGGIGGDGYKIFLLNKRFEVKAKNIFKGILIDRLMGLLALFCLASGLSAFIPVESIYKNFIWLSIPVFIAVFYFLVSKLFSAFLQIFSITLGLSFLVQLSQIISAIFILLAIGVFDQLNQYVFVFLLSSIVAAFPITIGGIGSREVTFLFGAEIMQLNISNSIALSLLFYIITAIVSLAGIYYSIRSEKLK
jgi:glycosyltransferase 2 family protein